MDANIAHRVLVDVNDQDYGELHAMLFDPKRLRCRIVYGGQLAREYGQSERLTSVVVQLLRAGRARRLPDAAIDTKTAEVEQSGLLSSDDPHVIAIALTGDVRLLCSHDVALCADFRNHQIVGNPRGNIYRRPAHNALVRRRCQGLD